MDYTPYLLDYFNNFNFTDIDHEITLIILEFILNSIEQVKPGFLLSSMCMFRTNVYVPESNEAIS